MPVDPAHDVVDDIPFGRDPRIEFRANLVGPPTARGARTNDPQAVPVELAHERRLVVEAIHVHAVQIDDRLAVRAHLRRLVDFAGVAGQLDFRPGSGRRHEIGKHCHRPRRKREPSTFSRVRTPSR